MCQTIRQDALANDSEPDDLNEYNNMDMLSEQVNNDDMPLSTRPAVNDVKES